MSKNVSLTQGGKTKNLKWVKNVMLKNVAGYPISIREVYYYAERHFGIVEAGQHIFAQCAEQNCIPLSMFVHIALSCIISGIRKAYF